MNMITRYINIDSAHMSKHGKPSTATGGLSSPYKQTCFAKRSRATLAVSLKATLIKFNFIFPHIHTCYVINKEKPVKIYFEHNLYRR